MRNKRNARAESIDPDDDVFSSSSKFIVVVVVVLCFAFFSSIIFVRRRFEDDEGAERAVSSFLFDFPLFSLKVLPRVTNSSLC